MFLLLYKLLLCFASQFCAAFFCVLGRTNVVQGRCDFFISLFHSLYRLYPFFMKLNLFASICITYKSIFLNWELKGSSINDVNFKFGFLVDHTTSVRTWIFYMVYHRVPDSLIVDPQLWMTPKKKGKQEQLFTDEIELWDRWMRKLCLEQL